FITDWMHGITCKLHHICIVFCIIISMLHAHHAVACSMHVLVLASVEIMGSQEQFKSRRAAACWHRITRFG
ncbi:hypothetical protein PVAP13_7KG157055, partial [Panicum virgatum]